jgi:cytochrome c oxidase assembly protein subunit 15
MTQASEITQFNADFAPNARAAGWIKGWLIVVALLVYLMVLVGGATRLTDSGLSIVEWKPVTGVVPPFSEADWQGELEKYRSTTEYQLQNRGMSLDEFKVIYLWEWGHRVLGRLIGLAFALPALAFWALGWTTPKLRRRAGVLFLLGGLQGAVGWWMVYSGLSGRLDVAPYRLMTHLSLALVILAAIAWLWRDIGGKAKADAPDGFRPWAFALAGLTLIQIMLGALVAGLDAGRTYTDWPLMDGAFLPAAYWQPGLGLTNLFENVATTQFNHRIGAYLLFALALFVLFRFYKTTAKRGLHAFAGLMLVQVFIGIWTLMAGAPVHLALVHQAIGAAMLVLAALNLRWALLR